MVRSMAKSSCACWKAASFWRSCCKERWNARRVFSHRICAALAGLFRLNNAAPPYSKMQISPSQPSLIMRSSVCCRRVRASAGICISLACKPSFTSSFRLLPKILVLHNLLGSLSKSFKSPWISVSPCSSLPTVGESSVWMVARIRCRLGALAESRTPYCPPWRTISGSSRCSSSIPGITMPYPVA